MRKSFLILCIMLSMWCAKAEITGIHASDARLTYVGRVLRQGPDVLAEWSATYVRVRFYGNYLAVRLTDTGTNYYNLYVDKDPAAEPDRLITTSGDTTIVLFSERRKKEHTLTLYKRTEGEQGRTIFHEFFLQGELLEAAPLKARQIEFIGDSYTCGYGAESSRSTDRFSPQTETAAKTYAAIVARYFDADYQLIAHSGMGIARNYNSKFAGWYMPDRYCQTLDMDSASATRWQVGQSAFCPQITVILLGGNDFSVHKQPAYEDFARNYNRLLRQIKTNYGADHPIICCVKKGIPELTHYVERVVTECGLDKVAFCPFYDALFPDEDSHLGADRHPNYQAHRNAAFVLIPYIATMTNWDI
ncbi:MAG: GDSL-type esterase/lipase family protein [Paludibacteraceae bacterium]|nr:GDSL-type esterase/lipase family protein [Paludibacteraceae bacterium]